MPCVAYPSDCEACRLPSHSLCGACARVRRAVRARARLVRACVHAWMHVCVRRACVACVRDCAHASCIACSDLNPAHVSWVDRACALRSSANSKHRIRRHRRSRRRECSGCAGSGGSLRTGRRARLTAPSSAASSKSDAVLPVIACAASVPACLSELPKLRCKSDPTLPNPCSHG